MILDVGRRHHTVGELGDVIGTAYCLELACLLQFVGDGEDVDRLRLAEEVLDSFEDLLMGLLVERLGGEDVDHFVDGFFFEHQGTQNHLFQVGGLGWDAALGSQKLFGSGLASPLHIIGERSSDSGIVRHGMYLVKK